MHKHACMPRAAHTPEEHAADGGARDGEAEHAPKAQHSWLEARVCGRRQRLLVQDDHLEEGEKARHLVMID